MSQQTLGAMLQCYKNPYATYKCIESFRQHYPDSTIVLISDNGYDYTKLAEHFNCIYIHSYENAPLICNYIEEEKQIRIMSTIFKRIYEAFLLCKEDYVMWLEDDVVVNKKITGHFHYDLNGYCPNYLCDFHKEELTKIFPFIDTNHNYCFAGSGGSVFNKNKMLSYFQNVELMTSLFKNANQCRLAWAQDFMLSVYIYLNHGTVGPYDGHQDWFNFIHPDITVQHQYKTYYNVPMPDHLKHLVEMD